MPWDPGTEPSPWIVGKDWNVPKAVAVGGRGAQKDQRGAWAESGQNSAFVMEKGRGRDFCSPVSSPALPICLPNLEGREHSIVVLASLGNAHTAVLVRCADGSVISWAEKRVPEFTSELGWATSLVQKASSKTKTKHRSHRQIVMGWNTPRKKTQKDGNSVKKGEEGRGE